MIYYSQKLKNRARALRAKGNGYKVIADATGIAKSTARVWAKDIVLSPAASKRLYTERIRKMTTGPFNVRNRRLRAIDQIIIGAKTEINEPINQSAFKLIGAMLYWAEGAKDGQLSITNSDPLLIQFMVSWMCEVFNVSPYQMKAHLNIYSQQSEIEIKRFWSELSGIPLTNFGKTFVKPTNKNFKKNTLYYGTIKIRLFKSADNLHRLFGWIRKFLEDRNADVGIIITTSEDAKWVTLLSISSERSRSNGSIPRPLGR